MGEKQVRVIVDGKTHEGVSVFTAQVVNYILSQWGGMIDEYQGGRWQLELSGKGNSLDSNIKVWPKSTA